MAHSTLSQFSPEEMGELTGNFRLADGPSLERRLSISSADLLEEGKCREYLLRVAEAFEYPSLVAAASMFAKRYSFLTAVPGLYAMTMYDKALDYSAVNSHVESVHQNEAWLPKSRLTEWRVTCPAEGRRRAWREQVLGSIFAGNLGQVWTSISRAAGISPLVLWENTAVYVYWLYEKRLAEGENYALNARIQEDYQYLLGEAPVHLFGWKDNPLQRFNGPKRLVAEVELPVRSRQTCCYYYQTVSGESYCSSCPKRKPIPANA